MTAVNYYSTADATALNTIDGPCWYVALGNTVKLTLDGFTSGQRYFVKVGLVGVRGQEVFSDPVSYIPQ